MRPEPTSHFLFRKFKPLALALSVLIAALFPSLAAAQSTGTISGRIFNPASGQYIRNAQIRVPATGQTAVSEDDGSYRLSPVPAGPVSVVVNYTGYQSVTATVQVSPGSIATKDFELVSSMRAEDGSVVKLEAFNVSSEREGNAKAIMEQRNSMNITNSVASDVFGDVAEGNIGEFLKHLPGVEIDLVQGEVRTIRLRGLGSEYTSVTMDGVSLASADANAGAAGNARAFSFEQVSLSSMDSIEVSKTISADVDANAPAGTINLKSKRAFNMSGRRITMQANLTAFSARFNFDESYGPDDRKSRKIHPGGIFEYSDVFFNKRLGLILNISESMAYSANARNTMAYNYTPTVADPRPIVPTTVAFLHAPRTNRRSAVTLTADYKVSPRLAVGLTAVYNYADLNNPQRALTFATGARNTVIGADPVTSFTTNSTAARVTSNPAAIVKHGQTITVLPRFEYKINNFTLDGRFSASHSISWYDPRGRRGAIRDAGGPFVQGVTFTAQRSSYRSADWKVTQIGGPDWDNGANYTSGTFNMDDGRFAGAFIYSGDITATLKTNKVIPIMWKAGIKSRGEERDFRLDTESLRYDYVGPGAGPVGAWAGYKSPFDFDMGSTNAGASVRSISGGTVWVPDLVRMGTLFRENPNYFTNVLTATNYYNAFIGNRRYYEEQIDAAYLMGTATIGKATIRAGLRREETSTDALDFNARTPSEVVAAGFPVAAGRATTIPGLEYQYLSRPKVHRTGNYDNLFPSASFKYKISDSFDAHFGFSSTIRRPTFRDVAGVWSINEDLLRVTAPNPSLKPEESKNLSARLAYYFEPVGIMAVNLFQNNVKGLFLTNDLTAQEFGNTEIDLADYTFRTTTSSANEVVVRGMELEYSQSLSFLPAPFKGLNVRASYTRNYAEIVTPQMVPHSANAGISYSFGRYNVYANGNWRDQFPTVATGNRFYRERINVDVGGGVRLTNRINFFISARNLMNEPYVIMEKIGANPAVSQFYEVNGTNWTFGIKGVF